MLDTSAPLGLIAGLGQLPVQVVEAVRAKGGEVFVLRLKGFEEPALDGLPGDTVGIAEFGKVVRSFREAGCKQVCFAGIVRRPNFNALKPDLKGMSLLPKVLSAARKGDDALLSLMVRTFEDEGFAVIGADEASGQLKAGSGVLAGRAPRDDEMADLQKAFEIAGEMGRLDIGQGAIVCDGLVLCVEAQEGTDQMLKRCATLDPALRGTPEARRGVLFKRPKPQQERRIDLPTIGVATVEGAAAAGLSGIGVEAGGALLIDMDAVAHAIEAHGMFLYGLAGEDG